MKNERIDETIDRVAAELTAVTSDASFSVRLSDRLAAPRRRTAPLILVPTTAALVVAVALFARYAASTPPERPSARTGLEATPREAAIVSAPSGSIPDAIENAADRKSLGKGAIIDGSAVQPFVSPEVDNPALAVLVVDELNLDPVDVAPLGIATLEISDIDTGQTPKEPS